MTPTDCIAFYVRIARAYDQTDTPAGAVIDRVAQLDPSYKAWRLRPASRYDRPWLADRDEAVVRQAYRDVAGTAGVPDDLALPTDLVVAAHAHRI